MSIQEDKSVYRKIYIIIGGNKKNYYSITGKLDSKKNVLAQS